MIHVVYVNLYDNVRDVCDLQMQFAMVDEATRTCISETKDTFLYQRNFPNCTIQGDILVFYLNMDETVCTEPHHPSDYYFIFKIKIFFC